PQSPVLEIGTNFTATCLILNTDKITADDLYWNISETTVPKEQYTKLNSSALNVTLLVTDKISGWLFCVCKKQIPDVDLNRGKFIHGILLETGYRPEKPENLSCIAVQEGKEISRVISCEWESVGRQTLHVPTTYTLRVVSTDAHYNVSTRENHAELRMTVFPNHVSMEIWVEAHNKLGAVESEHLKENANYFVKTNPPSGINVISEKAFPTCLLINWTHPIAEVYVRLLYQIRFCSSGSHNWTYVPLGVTGKGIESFRLQELQPDTVYVIQVRCKYDKEGHGYWSDWSANATKRTPEDRPEGKPDLWKIITEGDNSSDRRVQLICKDPEFANGRIINFNIKIQENKVKNGSWVWERILVNRSEADSSSEQRKITPLKEIHLADKDSVKVYLTASNSVGTSVEASLFIPDKASCTPIEKLKVWSDGDQLKLEWKPPNSNSNSVSEYVVEWVTEDRMDWQRESRNTRRTAIKGNLEKFVCYNISVYPIYSGWIGKPTSVEAFLEQGAPLEGPTVRLNGRLGRNRAELVWTEIPQRSRQGFITNYTIFYTNGTEVHSVTVPGNTTSYTLTSLSRGTKYDTWIRASTIGGSKKGFNHSFTTPKYDKGEIEAIVVGVSLGFLFVVVMTMVLCAYKKDALKKNFWPQIPNPRESTIGNWSPDYPLKADTPKENCLSGISVLDVDVCDGKCVFEEDKASLALKKDKYLSEEHSSGIGGSSCMSSPRQSVSDSDEGGDMADTTASTVQYSSVVASNGYKGQNPSSQPQQTIFSRSESTQPLLDSEENPDMLVQEGSRQSQRFSRQPCFTHTAGDEELEMEQQRALEPLDFCSLEENSEQMTPTDEQSADWLPSTPISSYMPQLGGYRPQ
uniref:Fibronectin type-III domain-containing protein n=1 Tax=Monopterus albus TaxID=43700 RepID=A0A3Q3IHZ7_MONAL